MRRSVTAQFAATFALLSAIVIAGFAAMTVAVRDLQHANAQGAQSANVLTTANQLELLALDLETGLRGDVIAGQPRFLQPYDAALRSYPAVVGRLESITRGQSVERRLSASIASAITAYVEEWATPLLREVRRNLAAARRAASGGSGKARIDAIRAQFSQLLTRESATRAAQIRHSNSVAGFAFTVGMVAIGIYLLVIGLVSFRTHTKVALPLRRVTKAGRRIIRGDLSARIAPGGVAEVRDLVGGFNVMAESLEHTHAELKTQKSELEANQAELENALATLKQRNDHIELLHRFGDRLAAESTVERVADAALQSIADAGDCEIGAVYLLDADSGAFTVAATRGLERSSLARMIVPGHGLAGRALAERKCVRASYGEASLQLPGLVKARDAAQELHLPVLHGERVLGVISLGRVRDSPFAPEDMRLVEDLGERAAVNFAQALALRRLERTAHSLAALLESTDEGIYGIDLDGRVTLVNRAALEQTGFTHEDMLGQNAHELLHHTRPDGTPYPQDECPIFLSFQTGEGARITGELFWRKDGSSFPVEYSAFPLFEDDRIAGTVITFLDVTAREQLARQRSTQHALSRVLAEGLPLEQARPRMLAAVCQELGFEVGISWEPSEEPGRLHHVASYAAPGFEELLEGLVSDQLETRGTLIGTAIDRGQPIVRDLRRDPPRPGYSPTGLIAGVGLSVTGINGTLVAATEFFSIQAIPEESLFDTLRSIAQQVAPYIERERTEAETQRIKDQFVATVSHELRTPLTAIDGWVHILLGEEPGPLTDDQRRFLETVKRNSDRLMRLVGDLLLAGQIESGKLTLELTELDVAEVARETIELIRSAADAKHLTMDVQAEEPVMIRGDRQRLGQLFNNLVGNAIKFTPEQGTVEVGVAADDGVCRITVTDTGIGIPQSERARLFERFFRASSATKHGITGTGLGLAISKAIAESHRGTIKLADRDGPGSSFIVELPLAIRDEAPS